MKNWYEQRDRRTDGCKNVTDGYKSAVIHLVVTADIMEYRIQLITHFAVLMLAKWCRSIQVTCADVNSQLPGYTGSFLSVVKKTVEEEDPFCIIEFGDSAKEPSLVWFIGGTDGRKPDIDYISIEAAGWAAAVGFNRPASTPPDLSNNHLIGAAFAACLGNAEIFRYLVGLRSLPYIKAYSLWTDRVYDDLSNLPSGPDWSTTNSGRIHLIGCGSIGSSFIYLLPFAGLESELLLVDPDCVKDHNTSSSLLFSYTDAEMNAQKTDVCARYLMKFGVASHLFNGDYREYPYHHNHDDIRSADIVLCFANENNIWSTIQRLYPPVSFHATTSKSWGLHIGRHIALVENCLVCTFKNVLETEFTPGCSKGAIPIESSQKELETDASHTAILPFLAPAAAVLTLAELQKLLLSRHTPANTVLFNMGASEGGFVQDQDRFGGCFVCKDQVDLYHKFGPYGKFWRLSTGAQGE